MEISGNFGVYDLTMLSSDLLHKLKNGETIRFEDTMAAINEDYDYRPTEFANGLGDQPVLNPAGSNEGSCKIFAFARLHRLTAEQTLQLFGDYYRHDVLQNPQADSHQNIRRFMRDGWEGINFSGTALTPK